MWVQKVPGGGVMALAYAPDGCTLYVADRGCAYTAWDAMTRKGQRLFSLYPFEVCGISIVQSNLVVRSPSLVVVWDLAAGVESARLNLPNPHDSLPVLGSDRVLYRSSDRLSLLVWEPASGVKSAAFAGPFPYPLRAYAISPDARTVAFIGDADRTVTFVDLGNSKLTFRSTEEMWSGQVWNVRFSRDGRTLAAFSGRQLHLWNPASLTRRFKPMDIDDKHGEATFAFHPTAPLFVALNREKNLTLFSLETGEAIRSLDFALGKRVTCVAFSPDGLTCAVGGSNKQFAVFDVDV